MVWRRSSALRLWWLRVVAWPGMLLRGTFCSSALPCSLSGTVILPCVALLRAACSCFMWQPDIAGVAHFVMDCLTFLGQRPMLVMMVTRTQIHLYQPCRLDVCNNHSFMYRHSLHAWCTWHREHFLGSLHGRNAGCIGRRHLVELLLLQISSHSIRIRHYLAIPDW